MKTDFLRLTLCITFGIVPLVYLQEIYAFTLLPKRLAFFVGMIFISIGWLIRILKNESPHISRSPAITCLIGLSVIAIASLYQTTHTLDSLFEITYQLALVNLFFISASTLNKEDIFALLWTITLTGLIVSIIGILQYHNLAFTDIPSNGHPSSTFGFRNFAAMYLIGAIPLACFIFLKSRTITSQTLSICALSTMLIFLMYTRTRGAWGGLGVACLLIIGILLIHPKFRLLWKETLSASQTSHQNYLLLGGVCAIAIFAPLSPQFSDTGIQRFDEKKSDITTAVTSVFQVGGDRGRLQMWANTLELITDYPFFGVGIGGWKRIYPHYDNGAMIRQNSSPVRPHNDYLWIASESGLVGFIFYISFLTLVFISLYRQSIIPSQILQTSLFAIAILAILGHSFFSFPKEHPQSAMLLYALCGIAIGGLPHTPLSHKWGSCLAIVFALHALGASALCYRYVLFDHEYFNALIAEDQDDWQTVEIATQTGLSYGEFRSHMWIIAGRMAENKQQYDMAQKAYTRALTLSPYSWHAHNGLGIVFKRQNNYDQALMHYNEALHYFPGQNNPNSVGIRTNLGALYKSMGKLREAEMEYRQILATNPEHAGANNNMGNFYKAIGQTDSALVAYQMALQTDSTLVQAHFNIADLYLKMKHPEEALHHAQMAAQLHPNQAHILWGLGLALEANKYPKDALLAYQQALEIDPQHHQARFSLANLYFSLSQYADAKHNYQVFVDHWQGDPKFAQFAKERIATSENYYRRTLK
jgi:tetratricopeptide (TPR) repeat protein/O-antigen ligase